MSQLLWTSDKRHQIGLLSNYFLMQFEHRINAYCIKYSLFSCDAINDTFYGTTIA